MSSWIACTGMQNVHIRILMQFSQIGRKSQMHTIIAVGHTKSFVEKYFNICSNTSIYLHGIYDYWTKITNQQHENHIQRVLYFRFKNMFYDNFYFHREQGYTKQYVIFDYFFTKLNGYILIMNFFHQNGKKVSAMVKH